MIYELKLAAKVAISNDINDKRLHKHGAIGIRKDGILVSARNGSSHETGPFTRYEHRAAHSEARLVRKLDSGAVVYVARVANGNRLALSKPCATCEAAMRARGVIKCVYSISDNQYGVIYL